MCISVPIPWPTYSRTIPYRPLARALVSAASEMSRRALLGRRRVHVHRGAAPGAAVLPHDPVPAAGPRARLDRVRDVAQPVSGPGLGQAGPQRPLTGPQQRGVLVADRPDADGAGGVTVPATQDRA